jgi:hypothetical protein
VKDVTAHASDGEDRAAHWDEVYGRISTESVSWYQSRPTLSLELIDALGVGPDRAVIDVGGGASVLVDHLVGRGCTDLTVLDVSDAAVRAGRRRLGDDVQVTWIVHDVLSWEPERRYDLWHDRAVFHFLSGLDIEAYRAVLDRAVAPGGSVIVATFAPDGAEWCSGLPVTRYDAAGLGAALGDGFTMVEERQEVHTTPAGVMQPFTWIAARRLAD